MRPPRVDRLLPFRKGWLYGQDGGSRNALRTGIIHGTAMSDWFNDLYSIRRKPSRTVVGMISGTSADSIDVAVCRIGGDPEVVTLIRYAEHPYDPALGARVRAVRGVGVRDLAEL